MCTAALGGAILAGRPPRAAVRVLLVVSVVAAPGSSAVHRLITAPTPIRDPAPAPPCHARDGVGGKSRGEPLHAVIFERAGRRATPLSATPRCPADPPSPQGRPGSATQSTTPRPRLGGPGSSRRRACGGLGRSAAASSSGQGPASPATASGRMASTKRTTAIETTPSTRPIARWMDVMTAIACAKVTAAGILCDHARRSTTRAAPATTATTPPTNVAAYASRRRRPSHSPAPPPEQAWQNAHRENVRPRASTPPSWNTRAWTTGSTPSQ